MKQTSLPLFIRAGTLSLACCFAAAICLPSSARADHPHGPGFSQLEFDKPVVSTQPQPQPKGSGPSEQDIRVILEEGQKGNPEPKATAAPAVATGQKILKFDWVKPADPGANFLAPRLRGPVTDPQHPATITTDSKWGKQGGSCDVSRADLLCEKARSLKELMFRFSGDPDFYGRQCQQKCGDASLEPLLTSFRVKDRRGQGFDVLMVGDKCRYQLVATGTSTPWLAMEGEGGTCICLPRGCAN